MFKPGNPSKSHYPKAIEIRFRVISGAERLFPNQTPMRNSLAAGGNSGDNSRATPNTDPAAIIATPYPGTIPENPRVGGSIPPLATINFVEFNKLKADRWTQRNLSYQL
jgi:hypothetical protein